MSRHDPPFDPRIDGMGTPAYVTQAFIESDRSTLRIAQIEVQNGQTDLAGEDLDLQHDPAADTAAARPGRNERAGQGSAEGLRFVVPRRPADLCRAGDNAVETPGDEPALRNEQHAFPIILQHLPRWRLEPTKPAAFDDRVFGRLAEIVEIGAGIPGHPLDRDCRARALLLGHGHHRKKFPISRSPASWLFSG